MGKSLIIKGADFSENGILPSVEWYITDYNDNKATATQLANLVNGGWSHKADKQELIRGTAVNTIRFKPSASGILEVHKATGESFTGLTAVGSISISSGEVGTEVVKTFPSVTLGANEFLVFGKANSQAGMYYSNAVIPNGGFWSKVPSAPSLGTQGSLAIDVGITSV